MDALLSIGYLAGVVVVGWSSLVRSAYRNYPLLIALPIAVLAGAWWPATLILRAGSREPSRG